MAAAVKEDRIRAIVEQHPNAIVAFVHAEEMTGRNAIPMAYALRFKEYGLTLSDVVQTNKPGHTGTDRFGRFVRRARFDGEVEEGREYILVDDHVTMGGTLRDLKDYIESKGGKVVALSSLSASAGGTNLRPTEEQIRELTEKGITNEQLKELGIADNIEGLTRSEARELLVLANSRGNRGTSQGRQTEVGENLGVDARAQEEGAGSEVGNQQDLFDNTPATEEGGKGGNRTLFSISEESAVRDDASESEMEESQVRFSVVENPFEVARLESEPKEVGYRNVVLNDDGMMGSPMASKLGNTGKGRKATTPFTMNTWEKSDENPDLADDNGKVDLIKPDGKTVGKVDYNPYIHIRPDRVNKQFKQAWERPNLVYVEVEYPASELTSKYKADKAKKSVGKHPWNGEELILSRWDKVVRVVPYEEVADDWVERFKDRGAEFDIIPPKLLPILAERGVKILPPHKGMGKACNDAYKEWKKSNAGDNGAKFSIGEEGALSQEEKVLRDGVNDWLRDAGFEVIDDIEEGQRVLERLRDLENIVRMGKRKSARETVVPGDESPFKATVVSSADDANIINKLEERVKKAENLSQREKNRS